MLKNTFSRVFFIKLKDTSGTLEYEGNKKER